MNIRRSVLLTSMAGVFGVVAFASLAQEPNEAAFEEIDKNADGAISPREAQESWMAKLIVRVDVDEDGYVSKTEYDEFIKIAGKPPFEEIDKNADGAITANEAQESWLAESFARVDIDQDGYVSKTEYDEARS